MTNQFNNNLSLIKHFVSHHGALKFSLSATPYGNEFYWGTDLEKSNLLDKLKGVLYQFDDEYHDEYDLETGSSREYIIENIDDTLYCTINYEWDYSYMGSKFSEADLTELIKDEICATLSKWVGLPEKEFLKKYYYIISFSTEENSHNEKFFMADWENEDEVKVPTSVWSDLKDSIIHLSHEHGANTQESDCEFDYDLSHDSDFIVEKWSGGFDFEELESNSVIGLTPIKQEYYSIFQKLIKRYIFSLKSGVYPDSIFPLG